MANPASENPITPAAAAAQRAARTVVVAAWLRRHRARLFQAYGLAALAAFTILAFFARTANYFPVDLFITRAVQSISNADFDFLMRLLTNIGNAPLSVIFWLLPVALLFVIGLRWESAMLTLSVGGVWLLSLVSKLLVGRPRPDGAAVHVYFLASDASFPSGHVLLYIGLAGFVWFLGYTLLERGWRRTLLLIVLGAMLSLIGVSRIYLGAHWASDVLGSYLLGSAWLLLVIAIYRWGKPRFFTHQPVAAETLTD